MDQPSEEKKKPQEEQPKERHFKVGLREVIVGVILLVIGILVVHNNSSGNGPGEEEPPPPSRANHAITRVPTICTIRGIPDSGYLNATLTGTTKSVVAVAVWIVDDHHWYFKRVRHEGASWSAPPDPTYLWEVGQPGDPSRTTFNFAMLARSKRAYRKGVYHQLPDEEEGRRTIPDGFRIVGEEVDLTKRELLAGGFNRRC
ncbi:MAG TPA: hypothetical protein VFU16_13370 [Solirubrobacterales bacterium]|nr:hypothetical protein [Solirubrobacterales bacterium]